MSPHKEKKVLSKKGCQNLAITVGWGVTTLYVVSTLCCNMLLLFGVWEICYCRLRGRSRVGLGRALTNDPGNDPFTFRFFYNCWPPSALAHSPPCHLLGPPIPRRKESPTGLYQSEGDPWDLGPRIALLVRTHPGATWTPWGLVSGIFQKLREYATYDPKIGRKTTYVITHIPTQAGPNPTLAKTHVRQKW